MTMWRAGVQFRGRFRLRNSYLDMLSELQELAVAGGVAVVFPAQGQTTNATPFSTKTLSFASNYGGPFGSARAHIKLKKKKVGP